MDRTRATLVSRTSPRLPAGGACFCLPHALSASQVLVVQEGIPFRAATMSTERLTRLCEEAAAHFGVNPAVHPDDAIFKFIVDMPSISSEADGVYAYFASGNESAAKLRDLLIDVRATPSVSLLEFAAGYGCVTRHLAKHLPEATTVACDIHPEAIAFARDILRVPAQTSHAVPEDFDLHRQFDVVFALSFFSHMPLASWSRWLNRLAAHTNDGGTLIFTTHGLVSAARLRVTELNDGFWFEPVSEQHDLDTSEYGTTVTSFEYVYRQIKTTGCLRLLQFREAFWWRHQDVFVTRKQEAVA